MTAGQGEERLRDAVSSALYGGSRRIGRCDPIRLHSRVADGQAIYLVDDDHVLFVAPPEFPEASAEQAAGMRAMRERLGAGTGQVILSISGEGRIDRRSFLIVPRCRPLAQGRLTGRLDRWRIQGRVLGWLRELVAAADPPDLAAEEEFLASLQALQDMADLPDEIRMAADRLEKRLRARSIVARHVPMHGDLWQGNVMRRADGSLAIIDWAGSLVRGYGIYDLVRFADSFRLSRRTLAGEIGRHAAQLGEPQYSPQLHLLGALGHYARHLGEFPKSRFVELAVRCHKTLESL